MLLAVLAAPVARAQVDNAAFRFFQQGNDHYRSERYGEALAAYRKADSAGLTSASLYFNEGNTLYRMDRLGAARLAYERAARLHPDDDRIRHNVQQLKKRLPDAIAVRPDPFWTRWWQAALRRWNALSFFGTGMALYLGGLGLFGVAVYTSTPKTWQRVLAGALSAAAALLIGAALLASWQAVHDRQAVVMAAETSLRSQADDQGERVRKLHEGALLDVIGRSGTWMRVQLANGEMGWLPASSLEEV